MKWTFRVARLGGRCGETMELAGREPTINTPPHLTRHPNRIHEKERFWFEEYRNWVRRYDTARRGGSTISKTKRVRTKVWNDRVCIFIV
jgi:hypothetical protein